MHDFIVDRKINTFRKKNYHWQWNRLIIATSQVWVTDAPTTVPTILYDKFDTWYLSHGHAIGLPPKNTHVQGRGTQSYKILKSYYSQTQWIKLLHHYVNICSAVTSNSETNHQIVSNILKTSKLLILYFAGWFYIICNCIYLIFTKINFVTIFIRNFSKVFIIEVYFWNQETANKMYDTNLTLQTCNRFHS